MAPNTSAGGTRGGRPGVRAPARERGLPAARAARFCPELLTDEGLAPHKVRQVYVAMPQTANTVIDVSATVERKIAALREHRSQIPDQAGLEARIRERLLDPASPPDAPRYVERFRLIDLGR